jgi:hypothetical protein
LFQNRFLHLLTNTAIHETIFVAALLLATGAQAHGK